MRVKGTPQLAAWRSAVAEVAVASGQQQPPAVDWQRGRNLDYRVSEDTIRVGTAFAKRWESTSPEARWLIAHELVHRSTPRRTDAGRVRSHLTPGPVLALLLVVSTAVGVVRVGQWPWSLIYSVTLIAVAAVSVELLVLARTRADVLRRELHADDRATELLGTAGVRVLLSLPRPFGLARLARLQPSRAYRLRRQLERDGAPGGQ